MYKKLKLELYYLWRVAKEKYPPVYYWQYIKNRFFGIYLLKLMPAYRYDATDDFEIHMLCQKSDVWMMTWAVISFLHHSGLRPKVIIHDDGSISGSLARLMEAKIQNLKVISRADADQDISKVGLTGKLLEYRRDGFVLILKLVDSLLLSKANKILVFDTDILFFNRPQMIVDFIREKHNDEAVVGEQDNPYPWMVPSSYIEKYNLDKKRAPFIHGGLQIFNKDRLSLASLTEYFENCTLGPKDYFAEAGGWYSLLGQLNFKFMPSTQYTIKGRPGPQTILKHFTSSRRFELYAYGIDMVRQELKI